jgi:hypothetical protein
MEIKRTFTDDTNSKIEVRFNISDDEVIDLISKKSVDERIVFFRKLFQTDLKNVLTFNFLKQFL